MSARTHFPAPVSVIVLFISISQAMFAQPPSPIGVSPSSGAGSYQTFMASYSDPIGVGDLQQAVLLIQGADNVNGANQCIVRYDPPSNNLYLLVDQHGSWLGPITAGQNNTLSNSQCTLVGANSFGSAVSSTQLNVYFDVAFKNKFLTYNPKGLWMYAVGSQGSGTYGQYGSWTVTLRYPVQAVTTYPQTQTGPKGQTPYLAGAGAPGWFSIQAQGQGDPVKVQNYVSSNQAQNTEIPSSTTAGHTPLTLWFNQPPVSVQETAAGGCPIIDRIGDSPVPPQNIYFFDYNPLNGSLTYIPANPPRYPVVGPGQILTSQGLSGVRGFMVNNATSGFNPTPSGNYPISATYLTGNNNPCAAADQEMGMWQFMNEPNRIVYFDLSDHTNCSGVGNCRDSNNPPCPMTNPCSNPVYQSDSIIQIGNAVTFEGTTNLYYEMYIIPAGTNGSPVTWSPSGYVMRVAVIDGNHTDRFATCTINGDLFTSACTADLPINWTTQRVQQLLNGLSNVVNVVATPGAVRQPFSAFNQINGLWMGR